MTQSIRETHDLVFGSNGANAEAFESRRWFRRPSSENMTEAEAEDLVAADRILAEAVGKHTPGWAAEAGIPAPDLDLRIHTPPRMPYDVFAFAAYLIENAGIYHRMQPLKVHPGATNAHSGLASGPLDVSHIDREDVIATAKAWRDLPQPAGLMAPFAHELTSPTCWNGLSALFQSWWIVTAACRDRSILETQAADGGQPLWWKHVWRLLAIADEAAAARATSSTSAK